MSYGVWQVSSRQRNKDQITQLLLYIHCGSSSDKGVIVIYEIKNGNKVALDILMILRNYWNFVSFWSDQYCVLW